jgi:acetyl esterase/lipase
VTVQAEKVGVCSGEWLHPNALADPGIVLYLHGGAYSGGSCITHRALTPDWPKHRGAESSSLKVAASHYAGNTGVRHPLVSPQYSEVQDLPRTLIHVGTLEALLDDSLVLSKRMNAQGSRATVKEFPGMWHVWQTLHGRLREADQSLDELGAFIGAQLTAVFPKSVRLV